MLTLGSLVFVAGGVFLFAAGDPEARVTAIGVITFFGACALVGLIQLMPRERIKLDANGGFTIRPDRIFRAGMAIAALGMAIGCYVIAPLAARENRDVMAIVGYLGAAFFGAAALITAWRLFNDKPLARLDREGVSVFGHAQWSLAWRDIVGFSTTQVNAHPVIVFEVGAVGASAPYLLGVEGTRLRHADLHALVEDLWRHRDAPTPAALQH